MNKRLPAMLLALMMMAATASACTTADVKETAKEQEYLTKIEYSNLTDDKTQKEVKKLMTDAGISVERQKKFFEDVNFYNEGVKRENLTSDGFEIIDLGTTKYDVFSLQTEWMEKHPDFNGHNCRITSFGLYGDLIEIDKNAPKREDWILADLISIEESPFVNAEEAELEQFKVLFSAIPTEKTKDVDIHVKKVQTDWRDRDIKFKNNNKVSLITVFFHENLTEQDNVFIGHVGLLLTKSENELYFVEKVSYQEPYQVIKFQNRTQLNDYLMNKYDIEWGQPTAKPFIMENNQLLQGYRPNPNNTGDQ